MRRRPHGHTISVTSGGHASDEMSLFPSMKITRATCLVLRRRRAPPMPSTWGWPRAQQTTGRCSKGRISRRYAGTLTPIGRSERSEHLGLRYRPCRDREIDAIEAPVPRAHRVVLIVATDDSDRAAALLDARRCLDLIEPINVSAKAVACRSTSRAPSRASRIHSGSRSNPHILP